MTTANSIKTTRKPPGKPWKKGQSGNPSGKPKQNPEVVETLRAASPEAAQKLIELMNCGNKNIELKASQTILDRAYGKPDSAGSIALRDTVNNAPIVFLLG